MKTLRITLEGKTYEVGVEVVKGSPTVSSVAAAPVQVAAAPAAAAPAPAAAAGRISITSPMPGLVFKILVSVGQKVTKDEQLIILEAMKMESPIYAPNAATVSAILVKEGDAVSEGQVLIQLS